MQSVRALVPRRLRRAIAATHRAWQDEPCWQGVFTQFSDVPSHGPGFSGDAWASETWEAFLQAERALQENPLATTWRYQHHELLGFYLASAFGSNVSLHVLDIGGGMAPDYLHLQYCYPGFEHVKYSVLDAPSIRDRAISQGVPDRYPNLQWIESLDDVREPVDVVLLNAVIQYVEDWKDLVGACAQLGPRALLFARVPLGCFETYASGQVNHPPSVIPCWFFNDAEFRNAVQDHGLSLRFQGFHDRVYEHANAPIEYRCHKRSYLLFERNS